MEGAETVGGGVKGEITLLSILLSCRVTLLSALQGRELVHYMGNKTL
jgi:hypothetical protein